MLNDWHNLMILFMVGGMAVCMRVEGAKPGEPQTISLKRCSYFLTLLKRNS